MILLSPVWFLLSHITQYTHLCIYRALYHPPAWLGDLAASGWSSLLSGSTIHAASLQFAYIYSNSQNCSQLYSISFYLLLKQKLLSDIRVVVPGKSQWNAAGWCLIHWKRNLIEKIICYIPLLRNRWNNIEWEAYDCRMFKHAYLVQANKFSVLYLFIKETAYFKEENYSF